eukprot:1329795-Amphidinium_carterae.2
MVDTKVWSLGHWQLCQDSVKQIIEPFRQASDHPQSYIAFFSYELNRNSSILCTQVSSKFWPKDVWSSTGLRLEFHRPTFGVPQAYVWSSTGLCCSWSGLHLE